MLSVHVAAPVSKLGIVSKVGPMVRKVAVAGVVLAGVGVILGVVSQQMTFAVPMTLMDQVVRLAQVLSIHLSAVLMPAGAVMIALSVLVAATGYLPVRGHPAVLVWTALGFILVSMVIDAGIDALLLEIRDPPAGSVSLTEDRSPVMAALLDIAFVIRWVGGTLLGLWVTGLLMARAEPMVQEHDESATSAQPRT